MTFLFLVAIAVATATSDGLAVDPPPARPVALRRVQDGERSGERQREGTKLTEVVGRFELAGDRITFYPNGSRDSYRVLENLALERVGQVLSESRARQEWTISGVLTEFRGNNYLLLNKAVVKSAGEAR
ncbi:hypothetical protein NA78x_004530 [Anatilimnocola sp. NA78]|uniref:hypothetical protein n=1 Tax=Anatilimnocola sp. NA78 TaxID=3415683 RepID=UPI003CE54556